MMYVYRGGSALDENRGGNGKACSTRESDKVQQYIAIEARVLRVRELDMPHYCRMFSSEKFAEFSRRYEDHVREVYEVSSPGTDWNVIEAPAVHIYPHAQT